MTQVALKLDDVADYLGSFFLLEKIICVHLSNFNFLQSGIYPHILMKALCMWTC